MNNDSNITKTPSTPNRGDRNITVEQAVDAFLLQCKVAGRKNLRDHRTVLVGPGQRVTGKRSAGPSLAQTELAKLPLRRVGANDFRLWFDDRHPGWMAASTRKRGMSTMRQFLGFVVACGWGEQTLLTACSSTAASEPRRDWLRPEQLPALWRLLATDAFDEYDRFAIQTLGLTGVRASELVALRANDLHAQEKTLTVRHGKGRGDGKHRFVPVGAEFIGLWHAHTQRHGIGPSEWMFFRRSAHQVQGPRGTYAFTEDRKRHATPKPMRSRLQLLTTMARERLSPEDAPSFLITPHVLRRTFACTQAIRNDLGEPGALGWTGLQEAMGHADLSVTTDYIHEVAPYLHRFHEPCDMGKAVRDILSALAARDREP